LRYSVPFTVDENDEFIDWFIVSTNHRELFIVSKRGPRFNEFMNLAAVAVLAQGGNFLASRELEAPSFEAAVQKLVEADPRLSRVTIIEDTDPLFDHFLTYFRNIVPEDQRDEDPTWR
jgi:hypothetical protein